MVSGAARYSGGFFGGDKLVQFLQHSLIITRLTRMVDSRATHLASRPGVSWLFTLRIDSVAGLLRPGFMLTLARRLAQIGVITYSVVHWLIFPCFPSFPKGDTEAWKYAEFIGKERKEEI